MKQYLLYLSFFCGCSFTAHAQLEFAPIGAEWVYNSAENLGPNFHPLKNWFSHTCTGDSVIGNQTFRKVGFQLVRQQGDKVYLWHQDSSYLVFDFGLEVGDTVTLSVPICILPSIPMGGEMQEAAFVVDTITFLATSAQPLKKFGLRNVYGPDVVVTEYAEKIGNPEWFMGECFTVSTEPWLRCYKDSTMEYISAQLLSFNITDCYFTPPSSAQETVLSQVQLAPNPVTESLTIRAEGQVLNAISITDVAGKILYATTETATGTISIPTGVWPNGVYFCRVQSNGQGRTWRVVKAGTFH